jgi:outer membrane protein TolC
MAVYCRPRASHNGKSRYLSSAALIATVLGTVFGQLRQDQGVEEYIRYALEHNPRLAAAVDAVDVAQEKRKLATSLPDPSLSGGYFLSSVETRVGPQQGRIGASQMIPWPGKLAKQRRAATQELRAAEQRQRGVAVELAAEVRAAYAELYATGRAIEISDENLRLLQQFEAILLSRYETGTATQAQLLKVQLEAARLEDEIATLRSTAIEGRETLRALLNVSATAPIPFPDTVPPVLLPDTVAEVVAAALSRNPSLDAAAREADAARERVGLARQSFGPDLMVMSDYIFTGEAQMDVPESGKDPWIIGGSLTIPLWVGKKSNRIAQAKARASAAGAQVDNTRNVLVARTVGLYEDLVDARRKIALFENVLIPSTRQMLSVTEEAYQNAQATVLDYLDAQRTLLELQISLARQRARRETVGGRLLMLMGRTGVEG